MQELSISSLFTVSIEASDPDFSDFKWLFSSELARGMVLGKVRQNLARSIQHA